MNHLKTWKSHVHQHSTKTNEVLGLALIAGFGAALFAPAVYREVKKFWSKNVIGEKYKETGKEEKVICSFNKKEISPAVSSLTQRERDTGKVEIGLKGYQDTLGNMYWGYDHGSAGYGQEDLKAPGLRYDQRTLFGAGSVYTAMYKAEDLGTLKTWLENGKRYEGRGPELQITPVDLIWRSDIRNFSSSGTPIS